ncbi:unnamed protein product [Nesidiocoris tenuis]|uniref:Uncharacterized protein n=1 Tax=Nesidiocoris tenuis TaxID=355587 RepID=A0A6H5GYF1_9HEMI|nr:unnamed protein product [Nesidiocoris tenuis]
MNGLSFVKSRSASTIVVPISTRGIGIHSQVLFCRAFATVDVDLPCSVFSVYRVSLFQLHYRVTKVRESKPLFYDDHFCSTPLGSRFSDVVSKNDRNFTTMARLISAVGNFVLDGVEYTPRFPVLNDSKFPDPTNLTASNLRDAVVALSDRKTQLEVRKYFYDHNPLPCARYEGDGDCSILLSNRPSQLRIGEIPLEGGRPAYEKTSLQGNISTFWSPRPLTQEQLYNGSLYLVGELPEPKSFDMNYALRAPTVQMLSATVNLRTIINKGCL